MSVNKNVTVPDGAAAAADTLTGFHKERSTTQQTATDFRDSRKSSVSRQRGRPSLDGRRHGIASAHADVPLEAKRSRHVAVAVPHSPPTGRGVATCACAR